MTPAVKEYAEEKIGGLIKFYDHITQADIEIGRNTEHHHKGDVFYAEVNLDVPGKLIRVVKEEGDVYKAIDKVKDHLKLELDEMKEKRLRRDKEELRDIKGYQDEE